MAVLKQELTRTTFQDRQIKLMTDLYTEVRNLNKDTKTGFNSLKTSLISGINSSIQGLYYSFVRYWETGTAAFISDISSLMDDLREGIDEDSRDREDRSDRNDHQIQAERYQQYITNQRDTLDKVRTIVSMVKGISQIFGVSLDRFMSIADTVSDLQNIAVRNTGLSRQEVVDFRDNVSRMVSTMNERTGNLYSKVSSFELLIGLINQTGIKNLEFYEEYGELFITTQKTMNVNLGTLAEFANNFYRVYKFSAAGMEDLMESIRQNTAGTSTSEEKLTAFLSNVASDVRYFEYRTGGMNGLEGRTTSSLDRIGGVYTWLRELGFDSDDLFTKVLTAGRNGATSTEYQDLARIGIKLSPAELMQRMLTDPAGLMIEILQKQGKWSASLGLNSSALSGTVGYNFANATQAEIMMGQLTRSNYESYMANRKASTNPEEDIFLSAEERTANATEDLGIRMTDLQESLGISLKTIYDVLEKILTAVIAIKGTSLLGRLLGIGGGASAGAGGSGWLSGLLGGGAGATADASLLSMIGSFLGSPLGKLGAFGLGVGLVVNDSLNNHGNDDLFTKEGELTDLGRESGVTEEDAAAYRASVSTEKTAQGKRDKYLSSRFGTGLTSIDFAYAESYYDYLRTGHGSTKESILHNTPMDRRGVVGNLLSAVEYWYNNNMGSASEDISPYAYYPLGTEPSEFDDYFYKENHNRWSLTPHSDSKWDGNPEAGYARGTPFIPNDQLALLHEGEAVIPAADNPFSKYVSTDKHSYLKDIATTSKNLETGSNSMKTVVEYLSKILMFMQSWKSDNEEDDVVKEVLESARNMNIKLQLYTGDSSVTSDVVG